MRRQLAGRPTSRRAQGGRGAACCALTGYATIAIFSEMNPIIASSRAIEQPGGNQKHRGQMNFSRCEKSPNSQTRLISCRLLHLRTFDEIILTSYAVL